MSSAESPSRRAFIIGSAGALGVLSLGGLAACSEDSDSSKSSGNGSTTTVDPDSKVLITSFPFQGGYAVSGIPQRLVFLVGTAKGAPLTTGTPDRLEFSLSLDGNTVGEPIVVERHDRDVPMPYYPLRTTFDSPGTYTITVTLDGNEFMRDVVVSDPSEVTLLQPGQAMKPVETPTTEDHRGVDPICTRDPQCPLHTITLTDALAANKPVALLIGSPAYCQTGVCGPVLDLLSAQREAFADVTMLHAEVYKDAAATGNIANATTTPAIDAYGLTFEPTVFFADAEGKIVERLDNIFDTTEIEAALKRITA